MSVDACSSMYATDFQRRRVCCNEENQTSPLHRVRKGSVISSDPQAGLHRGPTQGRMACAFKLGEKRHRNHELRAMHVTVGALCKAAVRQQPGRRAVPLRQLWPILTSAGSSCFSISHEIQRISESRRLVPTNPCPFRIAVTADSSQPSPHRAWQEASQQHSVLFRFRTPAPRRKPQAICP